MASGWASDGAVQEQIESTVNDEIARVRGTMSKGESAEFCEECGEPIPQARRDAVPGVRYCLACQQAHDKEMKGSTLFNRRGSKDSQLR
ncbi:DksA/TraR family C4-type zinc finger protein [Pantoea sp. KPR_PJ]|uniref:DksA/TraR family C4-type zinc finger protein n=1 Tax=Pantoea sp. KPR_PJ TaxID=2738375 RepID=UPI00352927E5